MRRTPPSKKKGYDDTNPAPRHLLQSDTSASQCQAVRWSLCKMRGIPTIDGPRAFASSASYFDCFASALRHRRDDDYLTLCPKRQNLLPGSRRPPITSTRSRILTLMPLGSPHENAPATALGRTLKRHSGRCRLIVCTDLPSGCETSWTRSGRIGTSWRSRAAETAGREAGRIAAPAGRLTPLADIPHENAFRRRLCRVDQGNQAGISRAIAVPESAKIVARHRHRTPLQGAARSSARKLNRTCIPDAPI